MEHSMPTQELLALVGKLNKICMNQPRYEMELVSDMAAFGFLFSGNERPVRMSDVSDHLMVSRPAATQLVAKLVDHGLIERINGENDRRTVYIRPTEAGRLIFDENLEKRLCFTDRVVDRIGEDKAVTLTGLLNEFVEAITVELEDMQDAGKNQR